MDTTDGNQDKSEERLLSAASLKTFMMKASTESNLNLYDHLTCLLIKVMDEQPQNVVDVIEDMSRDVKQVCFEDNRSTLRDLPQTTAAELLAEQQRLLFSQPEETDQEEELMETPLPNVSEIGFYMEQAGVGLGREEMQRVFLALKQLVDSQALLCCRLWGKILGTESSYIVAEAEYREGEEEQSTEEVAEEEERKADVRENEMDPLPHSTYKALPAVPKEALGTGANKFLYYVCKEPGLPWVKLPSVSPAQITAARLIRKFFTGRLDTTVVSYPPFPGNEANYLRAQIARISAGTQVSPQGFFQAGEEEGDEEDEAPRDSYEMNPDFEGVAVAEMAESLSTWVHHVQHILQQGRCTWVNLAVKPGEDSNEEGEAEEKEEEPDEPEPEVGPPLLTPLSQDAEMFNTPPWTSKVSSTLTSQHAVAVLRSNLWPGAHAYACGKKFENIYVGWGLKHAGEGYIPAVPPLAQREYPSGPDITEALDPSVEEEQVLKEALEEQQADKEEMEDSDEQEEEDDD
ncbi:LOW QUALITY PROTEIN: radial spoke head protein 4 homolog A [Cottoperca gobio]|uniref:LOW QUALITY PROTEIN: radial spoke head protein 4 homolog A n=1 Tax=Cottoperca gobio TaxID=56716 RepID=A0A6J2PHP5_COTGO|nr:LOW QUALITY PROTEIN: radial spoke head protein 4 homolog A-like [Cottoperca gobio]